MSQVDVRVESIWKQYHLGARWDPHELFWALKDVSFEVMRGSSLGVIGANGAGKSTLMKLLAQITAPTRGRMIIHGRLVALIEVGSGFHPELTGRENVFLSGAILGMRRQELAAKLPSIIEFAGVERFIDTPVKWYSSGMFVRLGFSIAAHLEPDVLLIDEVLAVGDAEFQAKCLRRIRELQRQGVTMIFISHDLTAVEQLCSRVLLLDHGEIVVQGNPSDVVAEYHRRVLASGAETNGDDRPAVQGAVTLSNVTLRDPRPDAALGFQTGGPLLVALRYAAEREARVTFELSYFSSDGKTLLATTSTDAPGGCHVAPPGGTVEFVCPAVLLRPGDYYVSAVVRDAATHHAIGWWDGGTTLHVEPGVASAGQFHMPHTWRLVLPAKAGSHEIGEP